MSEVLRDFVPSSLMGVIEANTRESFLTWNKWAKLELHQDADEIWIAAEIPYFIFNLVLKAENAAAEPGPVIDAAISRASSRRVPMGWWVGPSDPTPGMGSLLEARRFSHAATVTGMAVDLLTLDATVSMPPGFTINEVTNPDDLETWCRIMTDVSEFPGFAKTAWLEMYQEIGIIDNPQWRLYIGAQDDTAVSTSALFLGAGVAGIHGVTTLPEFRGRGIGQAMTHKPLLDARSRGYRVGVLYSSEMAVNIYRRLGFQEFGQGNIYVWEMPEGESTP
ncbi:MAG: hypothetical protein BZY88_03390 [SAR202 cluster bacterium Io17-Chloro-G9]|nr:MAG: hypothetical protein BZY88_03390 [SAR202 cluster bacterium Io17-Chloro-G9]